MSPFSAAVIGSGPNGLSAAIRLAQAGHQVVVYEAAAELGGGLSSAALTLPGFVHDPCSSVHPLGLSSPFWMTLPLAENGVTWLQPDAPAAHPLPDGPAVMLERSVEATAAALDAVDQRSYLRTFGPLARRWSDLTLDALAPLGPPRSPLLLARFGLLAGQSASGLARRLFRGPRAQALFAGIAAHSVLPLDRVPSAAIGLMLQLAGHGAGWPLPKGGAGAVSAALARIFVELGGEIRTNMSIDRLADVETLGPVLFDTGPRALAAIAATQLPLAYRERLGRFRYGPGASKVDWALSGPIPWSDPAAGRSATVHLGGHLADIEAAERAPWEGRVADAPYVLLVQHSVVDDSRAPPGQQVAWAYVHAPPGNRRDLSAEIEAVVEAYAPGFSKLILARHVRSAATLERLNPNYVGGDVNGGAADWDQLFTRPLLQARPYRTPDPRLYLCSASTPPGGGVHGMCGFHAAEAALQRWPGPSARRDAASR